MRVPLPTDFVARLSSASKDARMVNSLKETKADGAQVRKRPGLTSTGYNYSGIQGVLGLGGFLYLVYDDKFELSAYTGTPLPSYVYIGDLVGGYYAMIDNPPTSPGPGDAYWSAAPPGAGRAISFIYIDPGGGTNIVMKDSTASPWIQSQFQGPVAASDAATIKKLQADVIAAGGVIWWDDDAWGTPPHYTATVYRIIPTGLASDGSCTDYTYGYATGRNWLAGYVTSEIPAATVNLGFGGTGALVYSQRTSTGVTISSTGNVARILLSDLTSYAGSQTLLLSRRIEVSGATQPEYNGTFEFDLSLIALDTFPDMTNAYPFYVYYTMSGTPAASPATGSISIKHFLPV